MSRAAGTKGLLLWVCLLLLSASSATAQDSTPTPMVEIDPLGSKYNSCELVKFSVKNVSEQEVYVEIYAEKFGSNSWDYVDYPYDLKDPRSLYVKRILLNPDMLKPGASLPLTYDRCLRPTFVKESQKSFKRAIIEKDAKSAARMLQRFRVDVYVLDQGHVKLIQKVPSESFERIPGDKSAGRTTP